MKTRTGRITGIALAGVIVAAATLTAVPAWATVGAPSGVPCTASGAWYTEDVAPAPTADGLQFAGPNAAAVDWYHPVAGNLQGVPTTTMTISRASGYHTSLVWEINRTGTTGYATIVAEPYMNGWTVGQTGVFTVNQDTLVWTSKIPSGPGSQSQPIALSAMADLYPANALISEGLHLGSNSAADQRTTVGALSGCVNENFVPAVTNVPSGSWYTEDVAPVQAADGLEFAGPNAKAVDWYHPLSGNLQGVPTTTMTISRASGYHTSLVWEICRTGTTGYATIVAEPYMNGWAAGQTGVFTVNQDTLVWTSKITNPAPGSQASPITLAAMAALYPNNALISEGIHLGSNSTADQVTSVAALSGAINENFVPATVERFWSPVFHNAHFYTADANEAAHVRTDPNWVYEGPAFVGLQAGSDGSCKAGSPMYRFWSPVFSSHFYTASATEKDHIVAADRNWQYEGVAYCVYSDQQSGTVPLYRFWSPGFGKHFFTASQAEADHIRAADRNWTYEGIAGYVLPAA